MGFGEKAKAAGALGNVTTYAYDGFGRQATITYPACDGHRDRWCPSSGMSSVGGSGWRRCMGCSWGLGCTASVGGARNAEVAMLWSAGSVGGVELDAEPVPLVGVGDHGGGTQSSVRTPKSLHRSGASRR